MPSLPADVVTQKVHWHITDKLRLFDSARDNVNLKKIRQGPGPGFLSHAQCENRANWRLISDSAQRIKRQAPIRTFCQCTKNCVEMARFHSTL
jgi:hypothetical protein